MGRCIRGGATGAAAFLVCNWRAMGGRLPRGQRSRAALPIVLAGEINELTAKIAVKLSISPATSLSPSFCTFRLKRSISTSNGPCAHLPSRRSKELTFSEPSRPEFQTKGTTAGRVHQHLPSSHVRKESIHTGRSKPNTTAVKQHQDVSGNCDERLKPTRSIPHALGA